LDIEILRDFLSTNSPPKATPTQLELTLKIADRSRVFNGIVGSQVGADLSVHPQHQGACQGVHTGAPWQPLQLFAGEVVPQSQILIGLIVSGVAVLNESSHTLKESGADIPWTALWVGEPKIGADKQTLV
jgi:hypothetical protein